MLIYMSLDIFIILVGIFFMKRSIKVGDRNVCGRTCFFVISAIMLIFISAFRGDFTTDYNHYINIYNIYKNSTIAKILSRGYFVSPETGYILFQHIIGSIFHNHIYVFIVSSIITVLCNLAHLNKYTNDLLLSIMLFIEAGIYFTSFNLMRQCLAVSIIVMGSRFLYERKKWCYMIVVFIASTFHLSALIMIPFYFISTIKVKKNIIFYFLIIAILSGIAPVAVKLIQNYFWGWHEISDYAGYSWKNIVLPSAISIFVFISYSINNIRNDDNSISKSRHMSQKINKIFTSQLKKSVVDINNIWLNSTMAYLTFVLLGMWFSLANRFSTFFSIYALCLFTNQIEKIKYRKIFTMVTVILLVVFGFVSKIGDFPYYFIWDS